jgi:hypothetical protein
MYMASQAQMTQYQLPPQHAAMMGGMNFASPAQLTPANFGMYRPQSTGPSMSHGTPVGFGGAISPVTFMPRVAQPSPFMRPMEAAMERGQQFAMMRNVMGAEATQIGGQMLLGAASGTIGTGLGMAAGGVIGGALYGPGGAFTGADIGGMAGGMFGAGVIAQNPVLQRATAAMFRPGIQRAVDTSRIMGATRNFAVSGPDLDISGRGFSMEASRAMMEDFTEIAKASKGKFTRQDMTELLQMSGEQGLLDFVQNKDQVVKAVKNISGYVETMMAITGDPDVKNNIRMMGQLQRFGVDQSEQMGVMRNMSMYARGAGMDVNTLMQQQGAAVAAGQAAGIVPGLALQQGGFGAMVGRQAIAGGAIDPMQLAMLGGQQGVAQRQSEMMMGFLGGQGTSSILPYLIEQGKGGDLQINQERLAKLRSGEVSYEEMISKGAAGVDPKMMQQILNQQQELVNKVTEQLGPQGTFVTMVKQVEQMQRRMGGPENITIASAAQAMGMTGQQARQFELMYRDPDTFSNMAKQQQVELENQRFEQRQKEMRRREGMQGTFGERFRQRFGFGMDLGVSDAVGGAWSGMQEDVGDWMTNRAESERLAALGLVRPERTRSQQWVMSNEGIRKGAARAAAPVGARARYAGGGSIVDAFDVEDTMRNISGVSTAEREFFRRQGRSVTERMGLAEDSYFRGAHTGTIGLAVAGLDWLEREGGYIEELAGGFGYQAGLSKEEMDQMAAEYTEMGTSAKKALRADPKDVVRQADRLRTQLREAGVDESEIEATVTRFRRNVTRIAREERRGPGGLGEAQALQSKDFARAMTEALPKTTSKKVRTAAAKAVATETSGALAEIKTMGPQDMEQHVVATSDRSDKMNAARARGAAERGEMSKGDVDAALEKIGFGSIEDSSAAERSALQFLSEKDQEDRTAWTLIAWSLVDPAAGEDAWAAYIQGLMESDDPKNKKLARKLRGAKESMARSIQALGEPAMEALAKMSSTAGTSTVSSAAPGMPGEFGTAFTTAPGATTGTPGVAFGTKEGRKEMAARIGAVQKGLGTYSREKNESVVRQQMIAAGIKGVTEKSTLSEMVGAYARAKKEQPEAAAKVRSALGTAATGALASMEGMDVESEEAAGFKEKLYEAAADPKAGALEAEPGVGTGAAPTKEMKSLEKDIAEMQKLAASRQNQAAGTFSESVGQFGEFIKKLEGMDVKSLTRENMDPT